MTVSSVPYSIESELKQAGWISKFNTSGGGHYCVSVNGAPSLGSSPGDLLFFGHWTKPDGTSMYQRSNMDRSITTTVWDPMGHIIHNFHSPTLIESVKAIHLLNIV